MSFTVINYLYPLIFLASTIISLVLFLFIYNIKNNPSANWLKLLILIGILNTFTQFGLSIVTSPEGYELFYKLNSLALLLLAPAFVNFVFSYTDKEKTVKDFTFVLFTTGIFILFLYLWWTTDLIAIHGLNHARSTPWGPMAPIGILEPVLIIYFLLNYLHGTYLLVKYYKKQTNEIRRKQVLLVILACCVPFAIDMVLEGVLPILGFLQFPATAILTNFMCAVIAYAIYKYRLFYVSTEILSEYLVKVMPLAFFVVDSFGDVIATNPAVLQFGLKQEDVVGRPLSKFLEVSSGLEKFIKQNNSVKFREETVFLRYGKPILPVEVNANDLYEDGNKTATLLLVTDLSFVKYSVKNLEENYKVIQKQNLEMQENKKEMVQLMKDLEQEKKLVEKKVTDRTKELKTKSALLESQNHLFESFIYNLPIGAFLVDKDTEQVILVNSIAMTFLELPLDITKKGKKYSDFVTLYHEDGTEYKAEERPLAKAIKKGEIISEQVFFHKKDGTVISLKVHVAPVKDKLTSTVSIIVLIEDMTKEYQIDKSKSEFVSLASHQLRTPLSSINWYTEMLASGDAGKLNAEQKDFVNEISMGARDMADLITTLLNVSRINMGTFVIDPEPVKLVSLVEKEVEQLKLQLESKKIKLKVESKCKEKEIKIDTKAFSIILQNLLTNAIKYTAPKGAIKVLLKEDAKLKSCIVSISDNGYGIPIAQQHKIFDKWFRADNVKTMEIDGNGLGLYMVKSIVEGAGCKIWFESQENKGTTFYIAIPKTGMIKREVPKNTK